MSSVCHRGVFLSLPDHQDFGPSSFSLPLQKAVAWQAAVQGMSHGVTSPAGQPRGRTLSQAAATIHWAQELPKFLCLTLSFPQPHTQPSSRPILQATLASQWGAQVTAKGMEEPQLPLKTRVQGHLSELGAPLP